MVHTESGVDTPSTQQPTLIRRKWCAPTGAPNTPLTQQSTLIRRPEVEARTALSRSRIYQLMETGDFPRPVSLGAMSVAWVSSEVDQWINERIAERGGAQ